MSGDIDIGGVFAPALLVWGVIALAFSVALRRGLEALHFYRFVWHRSLFDIAMLIVLWGGVAAAAPHVLSALLPWR